MEVIISSVIALGALGIIFGAGLGIASKKLAVKVDERVSAVREALPGANCGGCGFPGCDGFAAAVVEGSAEPNACAVCSKEGLAEIGKVLGIEIDASERKVARVLCQGDHGACADKGKYEGLKDCKAAALVCGGFKMCEVGCFGLGTCANVCAFDAIVIGEDGIAVIDEDKCTACGMCAKACPQHGITLMPESAKSYVACRNPKFGKAVTSVCTKGCMGCSLCAKFCPEKAITMDGKLAVIDPVKCTGCGLCAEKCKTNAILFTGERAEQEESA